MIFVRIKDLGFKVCMVTKAIWPPSERGWSPVFACLDIDGNELKVDPLEHACEFFDDQVAELMNIAFITVGDIPFSDRFVTSADESDADSLDALNTIRDIEDAIGYVIETCPGGPTTFRRGETSER